MVAFVARPLTTGAGLHVTEAERHLSELLAARDHTLSSLADLEMDNILEKIPPEDYAVQRAQLLQEGAEILRQIDAMADEGFAEAAAVVDSRADEQDPEAQLEAAITRMRSGGEEPAGGFCPQCGEPVVPNDRYCSHCGAALTVEGTHA